MVRAPQIHTKTEDAVQNAAVSYDDLLEADELLTGTPTVTASPEGLTFDNVRVSADDLTINGSTVAEARAVQFRVTGGTSGTRYEITVTCGTTASPAQTLPVECILVVKDD